MNYPLQVSFRGLEHSEAIALLIRRRAAKLDNFADQILRCRVVVGLAGKHRDHGNLYDVRIDLNVPGEEIAVSRKPTGHAAYRDIHLALRDAFDSARCLLEDYMRRRRGAAPSEVALAAEAGTRVHQATTVGPLGMHNHP